MVNHSSRPGSKIRISFLFILHEGILCVLIRIASSSGSNEYTKYTIFNIKMKITLNYSESAAKGFFQETKERVRNGCGK